MGERGGVTARVEAAVLPVVTGEGMDEAENGRMKSLPTEIELLENRPEPWVGASINRIPQ